MVQWFHRKTFPKSVKDACFDTMLEHGESSNNTMDSFSTHPSTQSLQTH